MHLTTLAEQITELVTRRAAYTSAEAAILSGAQSYSIGNRSLTRADLRFIAKQIENLSKQIVQLQRGNQITQHRVVPRDI